MDIPWMARATLVRTTGIGGADDRTPEILYEGTLAEMTRKVIEIPPMRRKGLRLSLSDRKTRPYSYQEDMIHLLIESLPSANEGRTGPATTQPHDGRPDNE